MSNSLYRVRYAGRRVETLDAQRIGDNLRALGFGEQQIAALLAGRPAVFKRGLTRAQASAYQAQLEEAGLLVDIEPEDQDAPLPASAGAVGGQAREPLAAPAPGPRAVQAEASGAGASSAGASGAGASERFSPAADASAADSLPRRLEPVVFSGSGREFFGIWIVNILLMIVTLGLYAPWAKVRTHQYFYGHTEIAGSSFQYLADPWVIFRGRLIAVAVAIVWALVSNFFPLGMLVLGPLFLVALPWIVTRGLRFHAVNSAWRNVRFDFQGGYWGAVMILYVWPILGLLSLLLAMPFSVFKSQSFVVNGMRFGTTPFRLNASAGMFYLFFLRIIGVGLAFAALAWALGTYVHASLALLVASLGYLALFGYLMAGMTNLVMNHTSLGVHSFESALGKRRMVWIYLSNSLLIALTLGLFTPWAKVRMAAYRASCTQVSVLGDLDGFVAAEARKAGALGQELGEAFDVALVAV